MAKPRSFKSLILGLLCFSLLVLLLGVFLLSYHQKKQFLTSHLVITSQDAATSLALSLSTAGLREDWVLAGSMMDAIFDSGAYAKMELRDLNGQVVFDRQAPKSLDGVPGWFTDWVELRPAAGVAEVVSGWSKLGVLRVQSNPVWAYRELWRSLLNQALWFLFAGLLTAAGFWILLQRVLLPLRELTAAAERISEQDFSHRIPATGIRELNTVSSAFNTMNEKICSVFSAQIQSIERLRHETLLDALTGLENREHFDQRLAAFLAETDSEAGLGMLVLIDISGLDHINRTEGREQGDHVLRGAAEILRDELQSLRRETLLGRREGPQFCLFLPGFSIEEAESWVDLTLGRLERLGSATSQDNPFSVHAGIVPTRPGMPLRQLLGAVDNALRSAQSQGRSNFAVQMPETASGAPEQGAERWRETLRTSLSDRQFVLYSQPMVAVAEDFDGFDQLSLRLRYQGEVLTAAEFVPMAERLGMTYDLDLMVLAEVLDSLKSPEGRAVCVGLSAGTLESPAFREDIQSLLARHRPVLSRLLIEIPEFVLRHAWPGVDALVQMRQTYGFRIVVGRFGSSGIPFGYLENWPLDLVKLDRSLLPGQQQPGQLFYLRHMIEIVHSRGLGVLVVGVEDEACRDTVTRLGVDGLAGYLISHPEPWSGNQAAE